MFLCLGVVYIVHSLIQCNKNLTKLLYLLKKIVG